AVSRPTAPAVGVTMAEGYRAGVAPADVRGEGSERADVAILASDRPAAAAGVFTRNRVKAARWWSANSICAGGPAVPWSSTAGTPTPAPGPEG
ncbi:MAG: hypothetical protein WBU92_09750, partial [Candidatus Dormiibacterota bacterium]